MKIELDSKEMRAVYTEGLIELAKNDERIILCESDLMGANGTKNFKKEFPERTFDVGIAEANMIGVAAGLAATGKIPFANSFTPFATRRCLDQVTISCAYANLPVKVGGTDPGICAQLNGGTHQESSIQNGQYRLHTVRIDIKMMGKIGAKKSLLFFYHFIIPTNRQHIHRIFQ